MNEIFERTALLFGDGALKYLSHKKVAVFGVGGVGGYVCEALARCGVGNLYLFDNDKVSKSNINRQIIALHSTLGMYKTEAMKQRILDINPNAAVFCRNIFYLPDTADEFDLAEYDYVVDAVDTVSAKLELAKRCDEKSVKIISSMGAGNKLNPLDFKVSDIYSTHTCPLARVMRRELRKAGVKSLKVVYSTEESNHTETARQNANHSKQPVGSVSFVPSVCGLVVASEVIKDLIKESD